MPPRIYEEIETTAGFYGPALYGGLGEAATGLLTQFHDTFIFPDAEGFVYTPVTSAKYDPQGVKPFIIGVIPPAANVTGRILDRSATIGQREGVEGEIVAEPTESNQGVSEPSPSSNGKHTREELLQDSQFWIEYVLMCQRVGVDPKELAKVLSKESNFNPSAACIIGGKPMAKGLQAFLRSIASRVAGMPPEAWDQLDQPGGLSGTQQLPYMEQFLKRIGARGNKAEQLYSKNFGGFNLPTGHFGYMSEARYNQLTPEQRTTLDATLKKVGHTPKSMFFAYNSNAALDTIKPGDNNGICDSGDVGRRVQGALVGDVAAAIDQALAAVGAGASSQLSSDAGSTKDWSDEGSKDAQTSQTEHWKSAGVPLNQTELGQKLQKAQRQAIAEAQAVIEGMKNLPPLRLLVNPQQFGVKGSKIVSDGNWTRRGPVIEHWGDEQDTISASGKVAAFYTAEMGLSRTTRQFSASWRNLQSLYFLYKNNGGAYLKDPFDPSGQTQRLTYVGSIYIYYDGILYVGSFSNFNLTEADTAPFSVEYSFEFNVRAAFILDRPDGKYDVSYSYQNTNSSQPKPPLPTKKPDGRTSTPEEISMFQEALRTTEANRQATGG
jgi:hypothetical protein